MDLFRRHEAGSPGDDTLSVRQLFGNYGNICKVKVKKGTAEKFANTPVNCWIENGDIKNKSVPSHIDREWYIALSHERLRQFGGN